jgi:hypothetical protein
MTRQKFVGWALVVVSAAYLVYFLKVRLFTPGPFVDRREWLQVIGSIVSLMLGVMNVRLAARSRNSRNGLSNRQS